MKTFAVIPVYNEGGKIRATAKKVSKYVDQVVVVDDGSQDNTSSEARKGDSIVLRHIINMGKGAAMKTGIKYAIKNRANKIVVIDGDGQHDPSEIPKLLTLLEKNKVDIVLGIRQMPENSPIILRLGNWGLNQIFRFFFGSKIDDTQNGFRVFNSKIYNKIKWKSPDYFVETEMIANLLKHNVKFAEIPVRTYYHDKYKGTTVLTGLRYFIKMLEVKLGCL
jgi:UDP-N-acetylglucosamine---dolichyl-phosphate N-acetylglucosaminyltransferase